MAEMNVHVNDREGREKLGRLASFVTGGKYAGPGGAEGAAAFGDAMRAVGVAALEDIRANFDVQSRAGSAWPELGVVTVILRRGGKKIYGEADVAAKRANIRKLRDTNILYLSLQPGGSGNVVEVLPREVGVRVGTRLKRAKTHNEGGSARFDFDEKRFDENVSATKRGRRRPAPRKDGQRRSWKGGKKESPWNEFYFRMRGALRKASGRIFRVPARPFLVESALRPAKYLGIVERFLGRLGKG